MTTKNNVSWQTIKLTASGNWPANLVNDVKKAKLILMKKTKHVEDYFMSISPLREATLSGIIVYSGRSYREYVRDNIIKHIFVDPDQPDDVVIIGIVIGGTIFNTPLTVTLTDVTGSDDYWMEHDSSSTTKMEVEK